MAHWDNLTIAPQQGARANLFMRRIWLPAVLCATCVCAGCGKSHDDSRPGAQDSAAARQFEADRAATARAVEEKRQRRNEIVAKNAEDIRKESEEAFRKFAADRPVATAAEDAQTQEDAVARLRARMTDPAAMEARDMHFNAEHTALCLEVNYRENGAYVGFRRAYITPDVTWVEPSPDDVSHSQFELSFQKMGCNKLAQK
jgi:hypothetical protein